MWSGLSTNIANTRSLNKRFFVLLFVELRTLALTVSIFGVILVEPVYVVNNPAQASSLNQGYPEPLLLPDLKTLPPANLKLALNPETGNKTIRFSNYILNRGPGVLEMRGQFNAENGTVHVSQIVHGTHFFRTERETGVFYYHESHSHWHWEGFSEYKIWSISPFGRLENVVASSDKVGYCLEDVELFRGNQSLLAVDDQPAPTTPQYTSCFWRRQGLSIGWVDIYRSHIPGQSMDISHLENGFYALQSTVDPDNLILEENDSNNSALIYFYLQDTSFSVLNRPPSLLRPPYSTE